MKTRRRILSILVENEAGALSRIAGLFSARAYSIDSLTVAPTEDETLSRMTVVTTGDDDVLEQIIKNCNKLIEVFKVRDITYQSHVERELMLVKVDAKGDRREEMKRLTDIFRAKIVDVTQDTYVIEVTGNQAKLNSFLEACEKGSVIEMVRSGTVGLNRGSKPLS